MHICPHSMYSRSTQKNSVIDRALRGWSKLVLIYPTRSGTNCTTIQCTFSQSSSKPSPRASAVDNLSGLAATPFRSTPSPSPGDPVPGKPTRAPLPLLLPLSDLGLRRDPRPPAPGPVPLTPPSFPPSLALSLLTVSLCSLYAATADYCADMTLTLMASYRCTSFSSSRTFLI